MLSSREGAINPRSGVAVLDAQANDAIRLPHNPGCWTANRSSDGGPLRAQMNGPSSSGARSIREAATPDDIHDGASDRVKVEAPPKAARRFCGYRGVLTITLGSVNVSKRLPHPSEYPLPTDRSAADVRRDLGSRHGSPVASDVKGTPEHHRARCPIRPTRRGLVQTELELASMLSRGHRLGGDLASGVVPIRLVEHLPAAAPSPGVPMAADLLDDCP